VRTAADAVAERTEELRELLREFLLEHSGQLRDVNTGGSVVFVGPHYAWGALDQKGRQLQSRLLDDCRRLIALVRALLKNLPAEGSNRLDQAQSELTELIDQSHLTWVKSQEEAFAKAEQALETQLELIGHLYDPSERGEPIYVPDTNALAWNPDLETWSFDDVPRFTLVLTVTVLSELDRLKVEHRNPDFRAKAEGLINRVKGYRTRGELSKGVVLRRNVSTLRTLAVEPEVADTLPWLDAGNDDDRILASMVEVMRDHPRTPVVLVTRDINLQNKAEYAGVPFVEPPDPPGTTPATGS
jgi:hypothetical protein